MPKHIEAEGGELLIQTSKGYTAIIPKNMAEWVKEHIKSGNHAAVDHYVKGLKEVKDVKKAQNGMKMGPPVKKDLIRPDGTMKDVGYYGKLKSPMGQTVTEYSIPAPILGKEMNIPSLVPGLTEQEKQHILEDADKVKPWDKTWESIEKKAIQHATQRARMGMSPFYSSALESEKLFVTPSVSTSVAPIVERRIIRNK
jgi:hypothetical protein